MNEFKTLLSSKLPHEQRVIVEANELGVKVVALKTFIDSNPIFEKLEMDEKERFHLQYNLMKSYFEILEKRILNFQDLVPTEEPKLWFQGEERELTFGEKAIGVNFNPSNMPEVDEVKSNFAKLFDQIENDFTMTTRLGAMIKTEAQLNCVRTAMSVVKLLTFKE